MPYSVNQGVRIHYEVYGEGPPIVMVHANPFDHRMWMYQATHYSAFHKVIALDIRGYGRPDKPEAAFTLQDMTADVLQVCADEAVDRPSS
ncbi:MAG TPA: alpha/beta fold hydrolase [Kiloniellaceae bacterium]